MNAGGISKRSFWYVFGYEDSLYGTHDDDNDDNVDDDDDDHTGSDLFGIYEHTYFWYLRTYSTYELTHLSKIRYDTIRYRELGELSQEFARTLAVYSEKNHSSIVDPRIDCQ